MSKLIANLDSSFSKYALAAGTGLTIGYLLSRLVFCSSSASKSKETDYYETRKLLDEYLAMHFGKELDLLQYKFFPAQALEFPQRCADQCIKHYQNTTPRRALDIGCAVGASSFDLARCFDEVVGIDYSQSFINACNELKKKGRMDYSIINEGDLTKPCTAEIPADIDRSRVHFQCGDACNLPTNLGQFGCVLAANLICRLPDTRAFLYRLPSLVAAGGILVITSPYTWLEQFTPKDKWIGGYLDKDGKPVTGFDTLKSILGTHFDLIDDENMQFFIRETAHKNQWSVAHCTIWKRKEN
ncbi:hypothetical protein TrispH2_002391 [Trichoplax sp. H2]|uniref:Methyltransferase type 11 domain-containing protein n=1 Tax=Trichoplax adhaerens TaxID=10228 RepID=B3S0H9_TRIAD|nr:hypothetical protein TRIADDRAFT_57054 [Trichoplax adhaerens]EDV24011.1 hypothetical protein TRIADDRAFT_57054 [Trichoplax adhaerens]RDD44856.1 hypothetical protein TrispH2_002391 [Trichoplax sp. H2]|eukprot:XP_002113537.1 hypothetical protein TRIADDRAFT_57054 [Trichoplax adhaerens]